MFFLLHEDNLNAAEGGEIKNWMTQEPDVGLPPSTCLVKLKEMEEIGSTCVIPMGSPKWEEKQRSHIPSKWIQPTTILTCGQGPSRIHACSCQTVAGVIMTKGCSISNVATTSAQCLRSEAHRVRKCCWQERDAGWWLQWPQWLQPFTPRLWWLFS